MHLSALERMTRLLEVSAALSRTMTPDQVAHVVIHLGLAAIGARAGALLTIDDERSEYVLLARACDAESGTTRVVRLPLDSEAPIAACMRAAREIKSGPSGLCIPLLIRGHAIGALEVELPPEEAVDDERRSLLDAAADQCAQALERARLYALEQIRREELERSNRMKDDFLGIVSHELRTPLSAILGWARMLKRGVVSSTQGRDRALDAIERNATLQAHLVDDLLDVSRIVSGKLELEIASVDLAAVVEAALDSVRPTLLAKGLEVTPILARASVLGDSRRLQQVVWNLLTNSIKFTPAGGRIDVTIVRSGRMAQVSVRDNGVGIPADVLPFVFERFKQADGSATRKYGGLGLGLSIVRHVVEAHGGGVHALSLGEGTGTEVVVDLPALDVDSQPMLRDAEAQGMGARLQGVRVLLVEDDDDTRDYLATALHTAGAEMRVAATAHAALEAMSAWIPDVIVSDIAMPEEDGYAFIRRVRALPPESGGRSPAVALTALARPRDRVRALAAGFQTHLPKPVDPSQLVLAVATLRERS
jgi:signal transduction histidine kinase/CheY-like chemotaxis protein